MNKKYKITYVVNDNCFETLSDTCFDYRTSYGAININNHIAVESILVTIVGRSGLFEPGTRISCEYNENKKVYDVKIIDNTTTTKYLSIDVLGISELSVSDTNDRYISGDIKNKTNILIRYSVFDIEYKGKEIRSSHTVYNTINEATEALKKRIGDIAFNYCINDECSCRVEIIPDKKDKSIAGYNVLLDEKNICEAGHTLMIVKI